MTPYILSAALLLPSAVLAQSPDAGTAPAPKPPERPLTTLPYTPSLDLSSLDRTADPCVDFYQFTCGGWIQNNPIPSDRPRWSVYGKLHADNQRFLWGLLEEAAKPSDRRSATDQKIGDYFASCMDTKAVEQRGAAALQPAFDALAKIDKPEQLAQWVGTYQPSTEDGLMFGVTSAQDFGDSTRVIAFAEAGGLGLPDRDYYLKKDARSKELRQKYLAHVERVLALAGEDAAQAKKDAAAILALETKLAQASLTRVDKRDPKKLHHLMPLGRFQAATPKFDWKAFFAALGAAEPAELNVTEPTFYKALNTELQRTPLATWKSYLRWHLSRNLSPYLSKPFADASFDFYDHYLRGVPEQMPRWKQCVQWVDRDLGEALGQAFVKKTFGPEVKERTVQMTKLVEAEMEKDLKSLSWMSDQTKARALEKLHSIANKVGYPEKWRDYSAYDVKRDDFAGNIQRGLSFELHRQLNKIGKPVDRTEWGMTPPTVNAYYDPQMNDINFPAGVLQPPLFDFKMDDAPNYGNTGSTIGHELTHGFDDEGRQFDAKGNLKDWWTKKDAAEFQKRAQCVQDQYAKYVVIDDIHINSKLSLGEDIADLGGTILAYLAWKTATENQRLMPVDGFTPDQRFFIGFAQWACENERPESKRLHAMTDPHSPGKYRINGVVANMPEFAAAFSCKAGQPMVNKKICRVW